MTAPSAPPGKRHPPTVCHQHHEVALLIVWMAVVLPLTPYCRQEAGHFHGLPQSADSLDGR